MPVGMLREGRGRKQRRHVSEEPLMSSPVRGGGPTEHSVVRQVMGQRELSLGIQLSLHGEKYSPKNALFKIFL